MSRSKYRGKQFKEWWGKRPLSGHSISNNSKIDKFFKRFLHKIERKEGINEINNQLKDYASMQ